MSEPVPAIQFESAARRDHAARLGVWLFLASEILLFTGLFALYASYRYAHHGAFSAAARHQNLTIGTINTYVLITSSFTIALSLAAARAGSRRATLALIAGTAVLGVAFFVLKMVEYAAHLREGIAPGAAYSFRELPSYGSQLYFTLYYILTGLHAIHVLIGLSVLGWLFARTWRGRVTAEHHLALELGALYWHLVDLVWIFLWPLLYLVV